MKTLIAIAAAISLFGLLGAKADSAQFVSGGVGNSPCVLFNKILARDPDWTKDNYFSWAQGFMAGSNSERISSKESSYVVNAMTDDDQWKNLTDYCADHPDKPFVLGVMILYLSMPQKPHQDD
jgi:hypothetical protein